MLAIGFNTRAYKLLSFTIAGAFAGLINGDDDNSAKLAHASLR